MARFYYHCLLQSENNHQIGRAGLDTNHPPFVQIIRVFADQPYAHDAGRAGLAGQLLRISISEEIHQQGIHQVRALALRPVPAAGNDLQAGIGEALLSLAGGPQRH